MAPHDEPKSTFHATERTPRATHVRVEASQTV